MLDDGETLVPGFRQARALRVWAGVRPLFQDETADSTDTRDVSRTHALLDHRERDGVDGFLTITGGKLDDAPADGAGHRRRMCEQLGRRSPVPTATTELARLRGPAASTRWARAWPGARATLARRAADLRVRADRRARRSRRSIAAARLHEPRRHPPPAAPRHGPVPGRVLHLPRDGHPARRRAARRRAGDGLALDFLQERWKGVWPILYGDQLRQARLDDWIFQGLLDVGHLPD